MLGWPAMCCRGQACVCQGTRLHASRADPPSLPVAADTLTFGLVVMVAAGTYQLLQRGLLASVTRTCGSPAALLGGRWGLWAMWQAAEALWCCALAVGDALLGLAVLLAAPWLVFRSGLLRWVGEEEVHAACSGLVLLNVLNCSILACLELPVALSLACRSRSPHGLLLPPCPAPSQSPLPPSCHPPPATTTPCL